MIDDTDLTAEARIAALEKRVAEVLTLVHFQDAMRVKIEKSIGAIDQQLIKTDAGLHQVRKLIGKSTGKPAAKATPKATSKPTKTKKAPVKAKAAAKKRR